MIRISASRCSMNPCITMDELKSLGCSFIVFNNIHDERMDIDVYVDDDFYLQCLDFLIYYSKNVVVKVVSDTFDEEDMNHLVILEKYKKLYSTKSYG